MNRLQEKVKDIVEVRSHSGVVDFSSDAEAILSSYFFTDSTSTLMAKWLDAATRVSDQSGVALALAGYRGVGKSHFLAVLGSIASKPDLRSRIADSHVSAAAQALMRRRYPVINIRRGLKPTLVEEIYDGVVAEFGEDIPFPVDSAAAILTAAAERVGDLPLVVIVDTAMDRSARVTRDDGPILGELAECAKERNVLLCLALDDDISGADGTNAVISRTYSIDFLDQEHLYKVVNLHVFPKFKQVEPVISDIYEFFRSVVPNFRWSAQKFAWLYPLHPGILEVAPYVRLFVHDFALLGFACEAGERILGRPANSLIAFDEVFDAAEAGLRKIDDLKKAFAAYDRLNTEVVSKIPVIQRLQAKLILKALLLLSLDGRGASAEDICASMLIYDEAEPEKAAVVVEGIIQKFSAALPDDISVRQFGGGAAHYAFRVSSKDDLNSALQESITNLDPKVVSMTLRRVMQDRFSDFSLSPDADSNDRLFMECHTDWRGSIRRGRIFWQDAITGTTEEVRPEFQNAEHLDWEALIAIGENGDAAAIDPDTSRVTWRPDELRPDEIETILRHHALQHDVSIYEQFGEHVRASLHTHRVAVEKIFDRIMLDNGKLVVGSFDYNFTDAAKSSRTLSELFGAMLEPLFETRFPLHPFFDETLGMAEVSRLVTDLYVSSRRGNEEVQKLAESFALPLGIARLEDSAYVPVSPEELEKVPTIDAILKLLASSEEEVLPLQSIYSLLRKEPNGLAREAQHLLLASLVAERRVEFITSRGDRIGSRSLDLRIIWDDIVGIARTAESAFSTELILRWARILTADESYKSLTDKKEQSRLIAAFREWLAGWEAANVVSKFDRTSEIYFSTREWSRASRLKNTLGVVAEELRNIVRDGSLLDEGLSKIASTFADSELEYDRSLEATIDFSHFLDAVEMRQRIMSYLTASEDTGIDSIESLREALISSIDLAVTEPGDARNREAGYLWERFQREYAEHFVVQHDMIMRSHDLQEKFDDIRRSDVWREFQGLQEISSFRRPTTRSAIEIAKQLEQLDCKFDSRDALGQKPTCICDFKLENIDAWRDLPSELLGTMTRSVEDFRAFLIARSDTIVPKLKKFAESPIGRDYAAASQELERSLTAGEFSSGVSPEQVIILRSLLDELAAADAGKPNRDLDIEIVDPGSGFEGFEHDLVVEDAVVVEM